MMYGAFHTIRITYGAFNTIHVIHGTLHIIHFIYGACTGRAPNDQPERNDRVPPKLRRLINMSASNEDVAEHLQHLLSKVPVELCADAPSSPVYPFVRLVECWFGKSESANNAISVAYAKEGFRLHDLEGHPNWLVLMPSFCHGDYLVIHQCLVRTHRCYCDIDKNLETATNHYTHKLIGHYNSTNQENVFWTLLGHIVCELQFKFLCGNIRNVLLSNATLNSDFTMEGIRFYLAQNKQRSRVVKVSKVLWYMERSMLMKYSMERSTHRTTCMERSI